MVDCEARSTAPLRTIVFAARRTGSSLLVNLLRSHPQVLMHGELYHVTDINDPVDGWARGGSGAPPPNARVFDQRRRNPEPMLRHVQCHNGGRSVVGLKVFRDHLRPHNWPVLTGWCDVCILLRRRDTHAQYRSLAIARRTGKWKSHVSSVASGSPANASVVALDGTEYGMWANNNQAWYRTVAEQLAARRLEASSAPTIVELTLEDDLRPPGDQKPRLEKLWRALRLGPSTTGGII